MPIKNYFPVFHKLKSGAYSYIWTDKCEKLLPKHYKARCLEYMMREPAAIHYIPDTRKYCYDKHGTRLPVQNHPIHVRYPEQCNKGLWGGEGLILCTIKKIKDPVKDRYAVRQARVYAPYLVQRNLYSEILDKWYSLPCTNRVMDLVDEHYGFDAYILKTHERDLNSKIGMDIKRAMLVALAKGDIYPNDPAKREKILKKYEEFKMPLEEAEWVGLSIKEALEKAEKETATVQMPLKSLIEEKFLQDLKETAEKAKADKAKEVEERAKAAEKQKKDQEEGTAV